jgi:maltooligosyltrehalose trehalohydrolase
VLELYRRLLALRAAEPDLQAGSLADVRVEFDESAEWVIVHRGAFRIGANLAGRAQQVPVPAGEVVLATGDATPGPDGLLLGAHTAAIVRR